MSAMEVVGDTLRRRNIIDHDVRVHSEIICCFFPQVALRQRWNYVGQPTSGNRARIAIVCLWSTGVDCMYYVWWMLELKLLRTRKLCYRKDDRAMRSIYVDREPLRRYGHSKLSKMAVQDGGGRHLEFVRIENSAIRSAFPENPTL